MSANPEGSDGVTMPGCLVCETSKAFGARRSKINCREAFALGIGSLSRGSLEWEPLLQKWCLKIASFLQWNCGNPLCFTTAILAQGLLLLRPGQVFFVLQF